MIKINFLELKVIFLISTTLFTSSAWSDTYEVKVTNLTAGQAFTPRLAITHASGNAFTLGNQALPELISIAEDGNVAPMQEFLNSNSVAPLISQVKVSSGLLNAGKSETFTIEGKNTDKFTLLNMLIPTNDAFIGINAVSLPSQGSVSYRGVVYDAGSETNDEKCTNIPGPTCGGVGVSVDDSGEGFIHVHPGIHGIADLKAEKRDWRNPAVMVRITKK